MKVFKESTCKKLDFVVCDICEESCGEHASLQAIWGYESDKDLIRHDIDICEKCFDKTILFLRSIRKSPSKEPDPFDGFPYES